MMKHSSKRLCSNRSSSGPNRSHRDVLASSQQEPCWKLRSNEQTEDERRFSKDRAYYTALSSFWHGNSAGARAHETLKDIFVCLGPSNKKSTRRAVREFGSRTRTHTTAFGLNFRRLLKHVDDINRSSHNQEWNPGTPQTLTNNI